MKDILGVADAVHRDTNVQAAAPTRMSGCTQECDLGCQVQHEDTKERQLDFDSVSEGSAEFHDGQSVFWIPIFEVFEMLFFGWMLQGMSKAVVFS